MVKLKSHLELMGEFLGSKWVIFFFTIFIALATSVPSSLLQPLSGVIPPDLAPWVFTMVIVTIWLVVAFVHAHDRRQEQLLGSIPGKIRYLRLVKELHITELDGDSANATLTYTYVGRNCSDVHIPALWHEMNMYDSSKAPPVEVQGKIGDESVRVKVKSWEIREAASQPDDRAHEQRKTKYRSRFFFQFGKPVGPRSLLPLHSFTYPVEGYWTGVNGNIDVTSHWIQVVTDELMFIVKVGQSLQIAVPDFSVVDFHEFSDDEEMKRIRMKSPPTCVSPQVLEWSIKNPTLNDRYGLSFSVVQVPQPANQETP